MYLKSSGSGELRAGNFETDSETEIMNPDQLIMTLDSNADVEIEANVETGKGYVTAEVAEDDNKVIGEIKGEEAFDNIQALSNKYWNKPYPFPVQTERIVLKIEAEREFFFNLKDEDFDF